MSTWLPKKRLGRLEDAAKPPERPMGVPHEVRDRVVDFIVQWSDKTEIPICRIASRVGISSSKFYNWKKRYGRVNEHNAWIPRDTWLEDWEKRAIIDYYREHPDEGYRRLTCFFDDLQLLLGRPPTSMLDTHGFVPPLPP